MDPEELDKLEKELLAETGIEPPFNSGGISRNDYGPGDSFGQPQHDLNPQHPALDTRIDEEELYQEGLAGAAEADEPNAGNDVVSFQPPQTGK